MPEMSFSTSSLRKEIMSNTILSVSSDSKTVKGEKFGYLTGIFYGSPAKESGVLNACPNSSPACRTLCLYNQGRASVFKTIKEARIRKTKEFKFESETFREKLRKEIALLVKKAKAKGMIPAIRLNGTTDFPWESIPVGDKPNLMAHFPDVQFYDYTKSPIRILKQLPKNYHLTFSRSEDNDAQVDYAISRGVNVAVVFRSKQLPETWKGRQVVNGDLSDLRFLDPRGVIVGLSAKGTAKKDQSGFVIDSTN